MLKGNLTIWYRCKYRWNIEKWILRKLMSSIFYMKKLKNLGAGGVKVWLMQEALLT